MKPTQHFFCLPRRAIVKTFTEKEEREDTAEVEARRYFIEHTITSWPAWRRQVRNISKHRYFEYVVSIGIALNCVIMASSNTGGDASGVFETMDDTLVWMFLAELVVRYIAHGFTEFVRHKWFVIDGILIVLSCIAFFLDFVAPVKAARMFRLLRPLRALNSAGPMRAIIEGLIACARQFFNVLIICLIFMLLMSFWSLYFFGSDMNYRCVGLDLALALDNVTPFTLSSDVSSCAVSSFPHNYTFGPDALKLWAMDHSRIVQSPLWLPASADGTICPYNQLCVPTYSFEYGSTNFKSIVQTLNTLYTLLIPESWPAVMYQLMDSNGWIVSYWTIPILAAGTYFILSLVLVVVVDGFKRSQKRKQSVERKTEQAELALAAAELEASANDPPGRFVRFVERMQAIDISVDSVDAWIESKLASCDCLTRLRTSILLRVVEALWFKVLIVAVICVNTILLGSEYHGMSKPHRDGVRVMSTIITAIYLLEVTLKLFATPLKKYLNVSNVFDLVVTGVSAGQLAAHIPINISFLRIFHIVGYLTVFKRVRLIVVVGLKSSLPLMVLMLMILFIYAIIGVQLFGGKLCGLGKNLPFHVNTTLCNFVPRANFDNVGYGFLVMLTVATGDGWRPYMALMQEEIDTSLVAAFFVSCRIICGYLILNLFVAVVANANEPLEDEHEHHTDAGHEASAHLCHDGQHTDESQSEMKTVDHLSQHGPDDCWGLPRPALPDEATDADTLAQPLCAPSAPRTASIVSFSDPSGPLGEYSAHERQLDKLEDKLIGGYHPARRRGTSYAARFKVVEKGPFRALICRIAESRYFLHATTLVVLLSMFTCVFYRPTFHPDHPYNYALQVCDVIIAVLFFLETLIMVTYLTPWNYNVGENGASPIRGYFQQNCCRFEFVMNLSNVLAALLMPFPSARSVVLWLRIARTIRPWSIVWNYSSLSIVFHSLTESGSALLNVGMITFVTWVSASILALQMLKGNLFSCTKSVWGDVSYSEPFIKNRTQCLEHNYTWVHRHENFDNILYSMSTMFQIASKSEWAPIIWAATDAVSFESAPQQNYNPWASVFLVTFIVFGVFFLINVFVSSLIETYFHTKKIAEENLAKLRISRDTTNKNARRSTRTMSVVATSSGFSLTNMSSAVTQILENDQNSHMTWEEKDFS